MRAILSILSMLLVSAALAASAGERFLQKVQLPSGQTVVVAEGDFEARSLGSFSVRLYDSAPDADATTFFLSGLVYARDGFIEKVALEDLNGDRQPEVLVLARSAGTGNYLAVYAFEYRKDTLAFLAGIEELPPDEDYLDRIRKEAGRQ